MFGKEEPRADKLIFNMASQEKNFCDSFVYEPVSAGEEKLGSLYMLGEVKDVSEDSFFILNHIATIVKRNYYGLTQKPCLPALEETLKKVNDELQELVLQKKTEWVGKLHFVIGALSQNTFYFALCGNPRIFFIRRGEITDVGEKLMVGIKETDPQKTFRSIASGRIEKEDKVFMLTSDVFHSISKESWGEIVRNPNPVRKIKELSSSQKLTVVNTGGILIVSLAESEKKEREIFVPTALPSEKSQKIVYGSGQSKSKIFFRTAKRLLKLCYAILRFIFKSLIYFLSKLLQAIKKVVKFIINFLRKFKFFQKFEERLKKIPQNPFFQQTKKIIRFLGKKTVFAPILIMLVILAGFAGVQYQKYENRIAEWEKIFKEAQTKYKEGEIALIYGAEEKAVKSFNETESLVLQIEKSGYLKPETKEIRESIMSKLQKLLNMEIIENPEILATLGNFSIKFEIHDISMTSDGTMLFASDPSSALFYKFNPKEKSGEFSLAPISEGGVSKMVSIKEPENLTLFFAPPENIFFYIQGEKKFSESQIILSPYKDFAFQDLTYYKNNVYFLDAKEGEIIKFNLSSEKNELSSGTIWLSRRTQKVTDAKSIACDGSIWILDKENNILKYANGYFIQTLKIPEIFSGPTKIWTSSENPFLYVLDPPKKRMTVLAKKGQVEKQYFSEKFDNLKDFLVSEDGKTIYLLNGNQIFVVRAEL